MSQKTTTRVQVFSACGRYLRTMPARVVQAMLTEDLVRPIQHRRGTIRAVELTYAVRPQGRPMGDALGGQSYSFLGAISTSEDSPPARCWQFRRLHEDDRPLFRLSVTDCVRAAQ